MKTCESCKYYIMKTYVFWHKSGTSTEHGQRYGIRLWRGITSVNGTEFCERYGIRYAAEVARLVVQNSATCTKFCTEKEGTELIRSTVRNLGLR